MKRPLGRIGMMLAAVAVLAVASLASAKGIDDFTLLKSVPKDVALAAGWRAHPGQDFLRTQYARVWEEFEKIHIERDVKLFLKGQVQEHGGDIEEFEKHWQKINDLITAVDWSSLGGREGAFAMKAGMPFEFVVLLSPTAEKVKSNFDGLTAMLRSLAELGKEALALETETHDDMQVHRLSVTGSPIPVVLTLALNKQTILVGFGTTLVEQSLALLGGKGGDTILSSAAFQDALKRLPTPTDGVSFFDLARFMGDMRELVRSVTGMAPVPPPDSPDYAKFQKGMALPGKILDMCDFALWTASSSTTDGMKSTTTSVTALRDDAASRAAYKIFMGNPPISDPLKYVPKSAGEFSVNSGINVAAAWETLMTLIKEHAPEPEEILSGLDMVKQQIGLDVEKDIVGAIQGSMISFTIPGPSAYAQGEWVWMLRVDDAKAAALLNKVIEIASPNLTEQTGQITDAEIEGVSGFKTLMLQPPFNMWVGKPTFGVHGGWMFIGSGPAPIKLALDTAAGKGENFSKNERFGKEGLAPESKVLSLSFSDDTQFGEQLGGVLGMVPMIQMMSPEIGKDPNARFFFSVVGKMGRVVKKLDFFLSSASRTTSDGKQVTGVMVNNYREPPTAKKPEATKPADEGSKQPQ